MMGLTREDALRMSYHEYQARLWHWNDIHNIGGDVAAPHPEVVERMIEKAIADPRLTN